ncbi:leucine-rich repeat domain-containing protein [Bergeyella porcorum]
MKQFFTFLGIVAMGATAYGQADTDIVNIPDVYFKRYLVENTFINSNNDSEISYEEARAYTGEILVINRNIESLEGIEAFVNITRLHCHNNQLTSLDVSKNIALQTLYCYNNQLTSLDVSKNTALQELNCSNNQLTSLEVSGAMALTRLSCYRNPLSYLDLTNNKEIEYLGYGENTSVSNLMDLPKLKGLELHNIPLANIDYRVLQKIESLSLSGEKYTSVYIAHLSNLKSFSISGTKITNLDVSKNTALQRLYCSDNQLTSLDVSKNTALLDLFCHNNQLTNLDVSKNTALETLLCHNNQLKSLDISKNMALEILNCSDNQLTSLDVSKNTVLYALLCQNNQLTNLDVSKNTALETLFCYNNQLTQLNLANGNNNNLYLRTQNNPNLMCIQIGTGFAPTVFWEKDDHALYSDNCNYPTLSTTEVKAENAIQILNPVKDNLIIKTTAKVERIEIYNTAGQLVKVLFRGNTQVQDLAKGIYLLKITTDGGVITEKIIKQ